MLIRAALVAALAVLVGAAFAMPVMARADARRTRQERTKA